VCQQGSPHPGSTQVDIHHPATPGRAARRVVPRRCGLIGRILGWGQSIGHRSDILVYIALCLHWQVCHTTDSQDTCHPSSYNPHGPCIQSDRPHHHCIVAFPQGSQHLGSTRADIHHPAIPGRAARRVGPHRCDLIGRILEWGQSIGHQSDILVCIALCLQFQSCHTTDSQDTCHPSSCNPHFLCSQSGRTHHHCIVAFLQGNQHLDSTLAGTCHYHRAPGRVEGSAHEGCSL